MTVRINTQKPPTQLPLKIFRFFFILVTVLISLFPILWVIMSSFKTNAEILNSGISLPTSFAFTGYEQALAISPILNYFYNSIFVSVVATFFNLLVAGLAAYIFARLRFKFRDVLFTLLMTSMVIPMTALIQPVYALLTSLKLTDSFTGLILVYAALNLPMSLMILRTAFQGIPQSLEDAAYVDGAGFLRTAFTIILPAAKAGVSSAAVLAFLNNWNEFTFALILTSSPRVRTLPLSLNYFTSQFSFNYTALFAAITIAVIPSIIVFAIFQEQVVTSMTAGATKG